MGKRVGQYLVLTLVVIGNAHAQAPRTAKQASLFDITGYWVSVVTEDWRFRMVKNFRK
jgi:hypothetical protein